MKRTVKRRVKLVALALAGAWLFVGVQVSAQELAAKPASAEQEATKEPVQPIIDLGLIEMRDLRPARNETAHVSFLLHLELVSDLDESELKRLEGWKNRFRDQVITAVRVTETKEFQETDLHRLRRRIQLRVNRLIGTPIVVEPLLDNYTFSVQE